MYRAGWSAKAAALKVGFSYASAKGLTQGLPNGRAFVERARLEAAGEVLAGPVPRDGLCVEALRALDDFGFFRYRYFGRKSTPWQEEVGQRVVELQATPVKEFAVENCPPGSGKTTLCTLDIPAWLTVRNRMLRGLLGAVSQTLAERYNLRLRRHFEMTVPVMAEGEDLELGLAVDAQATLLGDFGLFRPPGGVWSASSFVVMQEDGREITQKEPTWSAYGLDSAFIGGRYDVCIWDDTVDEKLTPTLEAIEKQRSRWDKVAEKRVEPGGLLLLQGQRLSPEDIYRHCLDKQAGESEASDHECCDAEPGRKYHHFVYRAHWEDRCVEEHGEDAPYWPAGCLLDPRRLPWRELETEMANGLSNFMQVYQQEDADPASTLVNPLWINGGTDPVTHEMFMGCWDKDRDLCELPAGMGPVLSVATTDPSPTRFWANQWWCYNKPSDLRYLMDLVRRPMGTAEFLDWNNPKQEFTGLMEEWWQRSVDLGRPITHWIVEANVAANFILGTTHFQNWARKRAVQIVAHSTARNKADPKFGPQMLAALYQHGKVRLPGKQMTMARPTSLKLVDEVTKWPLGRYDDNLMAEWFFEHNLEKRNLVARRPVAPRMRRPSWAPKPKVAV